MLLEFTGKILRRGVIQPGSDLLYRQSSSGEHSVRHLHFSVEEIFYRRAVQIFTELPVQGRPGTLGIFNDLIQCDRVFQIFVDEFDRSLESGGPGAGNVLCGNFQKQPVTLTAGIAEIFKTADLAQFNDIVHYPGYFTGILRLEVGDPVQFQIFERLEQLSTVKDDDLFGSDFRFTAHGTVHAELDKKDFSGTDLIIFSVQRVIENAVNDHFHTERIRLDPFTENLTVPLVNPAACNGDRRAGMHLTE